MAYRFDRLTLVHPDLDAAGEAMRRRVATLRRVDAPRLRRLWSYYRNPATPAGDPATDNDRPYRQAQEWGLPGRITGVLGTATRKEVVIENDIGWRIDAMVDFLFGRPLTLRSAAPDDRRRARLERLLRRIFSNNGGIGFLQRLALLGAVYGHVDVLVKYVPGDDVDDGAVAPDAGRADADTQQFGEPGPDDANATDAFVADDRFASRVRFEVVEPTRAIPICSSIDPSAAVAYAQSFAMPRDRAAPRPPARGVAWMDALRGALRKPSAPASSDDCGEVDVLEVITPTQWQRYEDERLVAEGTNALGRIPLVHMQNAAVPFEYAGAGEVEPLMPLQDELNARLSDRAYRIAMQSARMYLGKHIDGFADLPIGPGRMYETDNADAEIIAFGGDAACPSEADHIEQVREALDKTSGVSPIAAGTIRDRIGNLTSAAALRVTLTSLLSRTERKRTNYGPAIAQLCELSLAWLDRAGVLPTTDEERRVEIEWPGPLPVEGDAATSGATTA